MLKRIRQYALLLGSTSVAFADEVSSSSGYLDLPDTLSNELIAVAQEGFWTGFKISTACMLSCGLIVVAMYLINRGAGR